MDIDLREVIKFIDPRGLDYQDWLAVGMGLQASGYTVQDWDEWSRQDSTRYHSGECMRKWSGFGGNGGAPVTGGTIVQMAKDRGWRGSFPDDGGRELDWDDIIGGKDDKPVVDSAWVEEREITEPAHWDPIKEITTYLELLFEASENVGYVMGSYAKENDNGSVKYIPKNKGNYDRTAGQLIEELSHCGGDLGKVFGDYDPAGGAWIRFNPLDGQGVRNADVTDFRYALVECDDAEMTIAKQNAMIRELELPTAVLVFSGKKSLHAIVKIEAANQDEYRKRVDYLYDVLKKNGMNVDTQNKNPSRLSRMPGIIRGYRKQFIVDTNIGKASWAEWRDWIESVNDDLPDTETLADVWDDLPPLAPALIDGVLRQGHKMLIAGPSKAGKSFALIELCIAIAEGKSWMGFQCAQGRVLYVNLELDRASCLHRFRDVYDALSWRPANITNVDIWNLRGKSIPMDRLAPKLIRRAQKKGYIAVVIDPIYKIITGDENSADQMAQFCNQFDKVCTELGCAVIYCHHHSKGNQGKKASMDRASGSGVFARDPDAMLDLIELSLTDSAKAQLRQRAAAGAYLDMLKRVVPAWRDEVSQDDELSEAAMRDNARRLLSDGTFKACEDSVEVARKAADGITAWRIDGTLREFPKFPPVNVYFDYPRHRPDDCGALEDAYTSGAEPGIMKAQDSRKRNAEARKESAKEQFELAVEALTFDEPPTAKDLQEYYSDKFDRDFDIKTIYKYVKKYGYQLDKNNGQITKKEQSPE